MLNIAIIKFKVICESCISGKTYKVTSSDKISYTCKKQLPKKEVEIIVFDDKMKVFIIIEYKIK